MIEKISLENLLPGIILSLLKLKEEPSCPEILQELL